MLVTVAQVSLNIGGDLIQGERQVARGRGGTEAESGMSVEEVGLVPEPGWGWCVQLLPAQAQVPGSDGHPTVGIPGIPHPSQGPRSTSA